MSDRHSITIIATGGTKQPYNAVGTGEHELQEIDLTYRQAKALGKWLCRRASAGEKAERRAAWKRRLSWLRLSR